MPRSLVVLFSALLSVSMARAEALPSARPQDVGLSADRLSRIGKVLQAEIQAKRLPGAVAVVARKGRIAYFEAFGARDPASGAPMTKDAIFRIYSMTKPLASVAAMILAEEGRIVLTDPVSKYLPAFAKMQVSVPRVDADRQAHLRDRPRVARDHRPGPAPAHLGPGVRRDHRQCAGQGRISEGRRDERGDSLRGSRRHAAGGGGASRQGAARAQSRRGLGIQPFGRSARPRRRGGVGNAALPISRCQPLQAPEDGRCGIFRPQGEDGAPRAALRHRPRDRRSQQGDRRERAAEERFRRGGRRRHGCRLPPLRADDGERRPTRRRAHPQPHHGCADDLRSARQDQGQRHHSPASSCSEPRGIPSGSASPSASRMASPRRRAGQGSSCGPEPPARISGWIRRSSSSPFS